MQRWYVANFEVKGEKRIVVSYLENDTISSQPKDNLLKYEQQFQDCYAQDSSYLFPDEKMTDVNGQANDFVWISKQKIEYFWDIIVSKSNSNRFLQKEHQLVGIKILMQIRPNKHRYSEAIQRFSITQSVGLQGCLV